MTTVSKSMIALLAVEPALLDLSIFLDWPEDIVKRTLETAMLPLDPKCRGQWPTRIKARKLVAKWVSLVELSPFG